MLKPGDAVRFKGKKTICEVRDVSVGPNRNCFTFYAPGVDSIFEGMLQDVETVWRERPALTEEGVLESEGKGTESFLRDCEEKVVPLMLFDDDETLKPGDAIRFKESEAIYEVKNVAILRDRPYFTFYNSRARKTFEGAPEDVETVWSRKNPGYSAAWIVEEATE